MITTAKFLDHSGPMLNLKIYAILLDGEINEMGNKSRSALFIQSKSREIKFDCI